LEPILLKEDITGIMATFKKINTCIDNEELLVKHIKEVKIEDWIL
jgi:hypothetical protein